MACWIPLTLDDGSIEMVNFDHLVRYKRQKNDGKKTILFEVGGGTSWVNETVDEIHHRVGIRKCKVTCEFCGKIHE